jgi:hypothetical protein
MAELIHLLVEFAAVTGLDRLWQRRGEELVVTCVVLLVAAVLQRLAQRRAQGFDDHDLGRAFAVRARNAVVAGVALILLLAWGSDLKSLAVSVAALGAAAVLAMLARVVMLALTAMQALALLMVAVAMLAVLVLVAILVLLALPVLARLLVARHQIHGLVSAELPVLPVLGRQADQPEAAAQQEILPLLAPLEHLLGALADQKHSPVLLLRWLTAVTSLRASLREGSWSVYWYSTCVVINTCPYSNTVITHQTGEHMADGE